MACYTNTTIVDFLLVKTDAAGNQQWNRTYGGSRGDYVECLIQTTDGGCAILGATETFNATQSVRDFYLVKTYANGSMMWNRTYDRYGSGVTDDLPSAFVQTADGGYALVGNTINGSYGETWLVKTDSAGNPQWNRTYHGNLPDAIESVTQTFDGGYALAGTKDVENQGQIGLIRTDAEGNIIWNTSYACVLSAYANAYGESRDIYE